MVLLVCLPLSLTRALGYFALGLEKLNEPAGAMIGFASVLGYLAVFFPALLLFEPFAIIASIWYTRSASYDEPIGRVLTCWLALTVHTVVLISYLRLGR
jgi:hypothetical protein